MVRTQVQLREDQYEALKRQAAARGRSLAELVRDSVDAWLAASADEQTYERLFGIAGTFHDPAGAEDVAEAHDRYLAEGEGG